MAKIEDIKIKIDASELSSIVHILCSNRLCVHNNKSRCNLKRIHIGDTGDCLNRTA